MSSKFRENTVEEWNSELEDGLEYRRLYGREDQWAKVEALFYNAHTTQAESTSGNVIYSTGDALLSTLLVPRPSFLLEPTTPESVDTTPIAESVLNTLCYATRLKQAMATAGLHAFLYGRGIIKHGYDSEFGYNPLLDLGQEVNQVFGLSLTQFDKKGQRIEYNQSVEPGMPWVQPILPHDFLVPYGTIDLNTSPWCAHRVVRHIDDIKRDPKYENKKDLRPNLSRADWVRSYLTIMKPYRLGKQQWTSGKDGSGKSEYVELWEIHDVRTGRVMVTASGYDKFLRNEIDYTQESGLPFVAYNFTPVSRTFWVTPDAVFLQGHQNEAIDIAEIAKIQRRISTLRFLYQEGAFENDELQKFFSSSIGLGIKYKQGVENPITAITPPNNNNQLQAENEWVRRDARETVGFSRNQMGEYESTGRRTAREAIIVQQNSDQRLNRRQDSVSEAYSECGEKLLALVAKFWRTPRMVEVVGQDGAAQWMSFTGPQIKGRYRYRVMFSSEPVQGLQARRQEALQLFTMLSQDPSIDQLELRRYLSRSFNDPEFTRLFKPGIVSNANLQLPMQQMLDGMGQGAPQGANQFTPSPEVSEVRKSKQAAPR